jgi:starvation-inducible DNA-binding protein
MPATTKEAPTQAFSTRIDIPAKDRGPLIELINQQLANLSDLYTQTKYAHWNVRGNHFIMLHKLFDELAELVEEAVDTVAERASSLGGVARGTARMAADHSALDEFPEGVYADMDVVAALADRYAHAGKEVRDAIGQADDLDDPTTSDMFTSVSRMLDKSLYFIEAQLQSK